MGMIGIALLVLTIAEAMSDLGLNQAIVQARDTPDPSQMTLVALIQAARGLAVTLTIIFLSPHIAGLLGAPEATGIICLASLSTAIRSTQSMGIPHLLRQQNFRAPCLTESAVSASDLLFSIILIIQFEIGANGAILGAIASEVVRSFVSWTIIRPPVAKPCHIREVAGLARFGRWIWGNSILTLALNQTDKILVSRLLGLEALGIYQVSSKIAQLCMADALYAKGQHLFPTLSRQFHSLRQQYNRTLNTQMVIALLFGLVCATLLVELLPPLVSATLGSNWSEANTVLPTLLACAFFSGFSSILAAALRAQGRPNQITTALCLQLFAFAALVTKYKSDGLVGIATAALLSTAAATIVLVIAERQGRNPRVHRNH